MLRLAPFPLWADYLKRHAFAASDEAIAEADAVLTYLGHYVRLE